MLEGVGRRESFGQNRKIYYFALKECVLGIPLEPIFSQFSSVRPVISVES